MDIRPIRTDEDHKKALERIDALWGAETGTPEGDELDLLFDLVEHYEEHHFPIEPVEPIELLTAHMEATGRTQADLAAVIGSRPRASEILNKRRALTVDMIHKINVAWAIPADCLVRPYHLEPA
ncbi:helix-turn-helix domain-containing protein [Paracoccus methylarcula]|uniref:Transcriptional regulator n=1 Tax=Paracoccus methylarcula TaxID=72022 RepID=A0A3R7PQN2_9RHOB|nr:transcriptional regulator [Paracoccus methylarcula]RNF35329.1 transcriptional regulator [Paracoccus methylarcula]